MTSRLVAAWLLGLSVLRADSSPIVVEETVDHGQPAYRIVTPAATWIYQKEGAGFSALLDPAGNNWISFRPGDGARGEFRGMPNAVFRRKQAGNNFFHPGHAGSKGAVTDLVLAGPSRVILRSQSVDGRWACEWEILPDCARFRMVTRPENDDGYWFLYEGTPGGRFSVTDSCLRPGGLLTPLSEEWESSLDKVPWVAFISPDGGHSLVLAAAGGASRTVSYRPMEQAMTVLGFGRSLRSLENQLQGEVAFTVALIKETAPAEVAARAAALLNR